MCCASFITVPVAPLFPTRSEPARSTRFRRPRTGMSEPRCVVTSTCTIRCERLLCSLRLVEAVARLAVPRLKTLITSCRLCTGICTSPGTFTVLSEPCRISSDTPPPDCPPLVVSRSYT